LLHGPGERPAGRAINRRAVGQVARLCEQRHHAWTSRAPVGRWLVAQVNPLPASLLQPQFQPWRGEEHHSLDEGGSRLVEGFLVLQ